MTKLFSLANIKEYYKEIPYENAKTRGRAKLWLISALETMNLWGVRYDDIKVRDYHENDDDYLEFIAYKSNTIKDRVIIVIKKEPKD